MLVIGMVIITINTINIIVFSFYINIRLYPLALSVIKLKLISPLLLFRSI